MMEPNREQGPSPAADWRMPAGNGLILTATCSAESPAFARFFAGYDAAFVLPDEKESAAGFKACLDQNREPAASALQARFGAFREYCLVAEDAAGAGIGGANFLAVSHGSSVTANLNYLYIAAGARRQGHFRRLVDAIREMIGRLYPEAERILVFVEQNDPLAMGDEAYRRDTEFTGLDQWRRLGMWTRLGARVVDFAYAQPPLSPSQEPDTSLVYSVIGADAARLSACLLRRHLRCFFGVSVLKGKDPEEEPCAAAQLRELAKRCDGHEPIALLDPSSALSVPLSREGYAARYLGAASFREALRKAHASPP